MSFPFTIRKLATGGFYHEFGNGSNEVFLSDFEVEIDNAKRTFIVQPKNGSNIPSSAVSFNDLRVIDESVSTSPLPFADAESLRLLLKGMDYTPLIDNNSGSTTPIPIYRKGQVIILYTDQTYINNNFDSAGIGINEQIGWKKCTDLAGRVPVGQSSTVPFVNIQSQGGSPNTVLVAHDHDMPDIMGDPTATLGAGGGGNVRSSITKKTSKDGKNQSGGFSSTETGENKNLQPYTVVLFIERTSDLILVGSNTILPIIDLPYVLAIGDRTFQEVSATAGVYEFQITDRTKETLLDNSVANCVLYDDGSWPENSKVEFTTHETPSTFSTTNDVRYQGNIITSLVIYPGDLCYLKKIGTDPLWELVVTNRVVEKKFSCQITQSGTDPIEIVAGSIKGSDGATITTSYIGPGEGMITSDLPTFAGAKAFQSNTASLRLNIITSLELSTPLSAWQFRVVDDYNLYVTSVFDIFSAALSDNVLIEPQQLTVEY